MSSSLTPSLTPLTKSVFLPPHLPTRTSYTTTNTNTATTTPGPGYSNVALLTESDTTVTAFQVPGTTGLLVVDGTTLTWREDGITLSNGDVISAGLDGLEDKTTTAALAPIGASTTAAGGNGTSSSGIYTIETINPSSSGNSSKITIVHGTHTTQTTKGGTKTTASMTTSGGAGTGTGGGAGTASGAASSSSAGAAPSLGAAKTVALLGALGGLMGLGL